MAIAVVIGDDQQVRLSINPLDRAGNPARVDGAPSWVSSNESIVSIQPEANGLVALAVAVNQIGVAQITVTADADLGSGVLNLSETATISVVGGQAVSLGMSAGAPEPRP